MKKTTIEVPEDFECLSVERWPKEVIAVIEKYGEYRKWSLMAKKIQEVYGFSYSPNTLQKKYETIFFNK